MGEVVEWGGRTRGPVPVGVVLERARGCREVFVLGVGEDGGLFVASSTGDVGALMFLYERWKARLFVGEPGWED